MKVCIRRLLMVLGFASLFATPATAQSVMGTYYGAEMLGRGHSGHTANGERFQPGGYTCAHRTLPFGTRLRVTNPRTGRAVVVRVNDRGPGRPGYVLDLAQGAARAIGFSSGRLLMAIIR